MLYTALMPLVFVNVMGVRHLLEPQRALAHGRIVFEVTCVHLQGLWGPAYLRSVCLVCVVYAAGGRHWGHRGLGLHRHVLLCRHDHDHHWVGTIRPYPR